MNSFEQEHLKNIKSGRGCLKKKGLERDNPGKENLAVNKPDIAINKSDIAVNKLDIAFNKVQITTWGGGG